MPRKLSLNILAFSSIIFIVLSELLLATFLIKRNKIIYKIISIKRPIKKIYFLFGIKNKKFYFLFQLDC